jgi:hypothetical protein
MIPVVRHLHRALGIDRDGHRIIERIIEGHNPSPLKPQPEPAKVVMMPPLILRTRP